MGKKHKKPASGKQGNKQTSAHGQSTSGRQKPSAVQVLLYVLFGLLFTLSAAIIGLYVYYTKTYPGQPFKDLLYTLASPLQGTAGTTVSEVVKNTVIPGVLAAASYAVAVLVLELVLRRQIPKAISWIKRSGAVLCAGCLAVTITVVSIDLGVVDYIVLSNSETSVYEDYYVFPVANVGSGTPGKLADGTVSALGKTKNLIYIYVESLETTYVSTEEGGKQVENYMPLLTQLAKDNVSFTDKANGTMGGFHTPQGTGWTMSALLATSAGIPFSFPLGKNGHNAMAKEKIFASGLTSLGDILEEFGYEQEFLCGSNADFGGRTKYFKQHGNYEIYDLYTAQKNGDLPKMTNESGKEIAYHNGFWGYEDRYLFEIAKKELTRLAAQDQPFNLTMLTVDLHHNGGYICDLCGDQYNEGLSAAYAQTANVIDCNDKLITQFVTWCTQQDFYEDTVIVVTGDHPRMDYRLVSKVDFYERTVYNCFINAAVTPSGSTVGREMTSFDMFPSTLSAMGFSIQGDRLGLGTDLFSKRETLAEEMGYATLEEEISKFSAFYIEKFCPELADRVTEAQTDAPAEDTKA